MPAKTERQRRAAGAALAVKRGQRKVKSLRDASYQMYRKMSERELERMAQAKH